MSSVMYINYLVLYHMSSALVETNIDQLAKIGLACHVIVHVLYVCNPADHYIKERRGEALPHGKP